MVTYTLQLLTKIIVAKTY